MASKILLVEHIAMKIAARRKGEGSSNRGASGVPPQPVRDGSALALPAGVKQCDLRHGIVADVPGCERGPFQGCRCGDQAVRKLQRAASVTPFEASGQLGDGSGDGEDDEAVEQRVCGFALVRSHAGVNLRDRNCGTARDRLPSRGEEKLARRWTPAQEVDEDVRVEQKLAHPRDCGRGRRDRRRRRTNAREPRVSSGCLDVFQAPKLPSTALRNLRRVNSCRNASPTTRLCSPLGTARRSSSSRSSGSMKFACLMAGRTRVTSCVLYVHLQSDIVGADRSNEVTERWSAMEER
jgi:hypothetical protein